MMRKQAGYTLVEVIVAITILGIGSAILWYSLRSSARLEKMNRLHHEATVLARSELESLRSIPRQAIRDTSYRVPGPGGDELLVVREVFDSTRIASSLPEITLDDRMAPVELRKPLEVRVRVLKSADAGGEGIAESAWDWNQGTDGPGDEGKRVLSSLILKIPEYRWH